MRSTGRRGATLEALGQSEPTRGAAGRSWYSLQFSSSLPSGQSSNPLHWKRPMMQWMPLAQGKNVGPHFDLALATGGKTRQTAGREGVTSSDPWRTHPTNSERAEGSLHISLEDPKDFLPPSTHCQRPASLGAHTHDPRGRGWLIPLCLHGPRTKPGSTRMCFTKERMGEQTVMEAT